jgi:endonuclease/exonuclease/phosphatase (EEP) superfamily protein YafD
MPGKKFFFEQIKHTQKALGELKGKVILMGDFNECYDKVKHHFPGLDLISGKTKTCSFTPILRWFCFKDMDHILVKGLKKKSIGFVRGNSDHKAVWADLK